MPKDYTKKRAMATRLIRKQGYTTTLEKPASDEPTNPWEPPTGSPTQHEVTVVEDNRRVRDRDGTLTGQTLTTFTVAAKGVVPTKADRIQVGETWHEIDAVRRTAPGGEAVIYEVDLIV